MIAARAFKGRKIEEFATVARVEIYTKWGCPYCVAAKALLDGKGITYEEYDITMGGPKRTEMLERVPDAVTVPQVLVDDQALGGFDDISALDRQGKLDVVLGL
jgi:glutaredoxin 3